MCYFIFKIVQSMLDQKVGNIVFLEDYSTETLFKVNFLNICFTVLFCIYDFRLIIAGFKNKSRECYHCTCPQLVTE